MTARTSSTLAPPPGHTVRPMTMDDVSAAVEIITAAEVAEVGEADFSRDELLDELSRINLETDTWLVANGPGQAVGVAMLSDRAKAYLDTWAATQPDHRGKGIGGFLLDAAETRAVERIPEAPEGARVVIDNWVASVNTAAQELLKQRAYRERRRFWRMSIDMTDQPSPAEWPADVQLRTFVRGQDERAIFDAVEEAFSDHWGHVPREFDKWVVKTTRESFKPDLWFFAMDGDQIAGFSLCSDGTETPWVDTLGVLRPWRQRGLGLALLRHSFVELWRRGYRKVALGVDSENLTGATRLYERAGMKVDREWIVYEKELRPGTEIATQSL